MPSRQMDNEHWGFIATATNVLDFVHDRRLQNMERGTREDLAKGIPANAPLCQLHRANLAAQSRAGQNDGRTPEPEVRLAGDEVLLDGFEGKLFPGDPIAAAPKIAMATTLLPCCLACFLKSNNLPDRTPVPEGFDSCSCASKFLESKCTICTLVDITNRYNTAVAERIRLDENDRAYIACECGNHTVDHAPDVELIRRCAGCGGTVTFPFRNWEGSSLDFKLRLFGAEWVFPSDEMVARQQKMAPPTSLLNGVNNVDTSWIERMQPKSSTAINDHEMPLMYARWEAERAKNVGGQVTAGHGTSSPGMFENGESTEVDVTMGDDRNEDAGGRVLGETDRPQKQVVNKGPTTDPQDQASAISESSGPTQQLPLPSFAAVAANPNIQPIISRDAPDRRNEIHRLMKHAGFMDFPAIARANASVGLSLVESGRVMSFVRAKGRRGIDGTELVWAIERGLKKKIRPEKV